jgi:hypothetical protein
VTRQTNTFGNDPDPMESPDEIKTEHVLGLDLGQAADPSALTVTRKATPFKEEGGTTPGRLLDAVDEQGITAVVDTAEPKGQGAPKDRPTAPEKRCLAFTAEDVETLADTLGEAVGKEQVPA